MATRWHPEEGRVASLAEIELMATVLEGRHGVLAADIAEFLAAVHRDQQDPLRGRAWSTVAEAVRRREQRRTA
jgi:hypothetical protein